MKLKAGDRVMVIAGKDAGTESRIEKVYPAEQDPGRRCQRGQAHTKTNPQQPNSGGIVDKDMPIDVSNVMIMCKCGPTRIGAKQDAKGQDPTCVKCGGEL
jgi:large subunit ribosomal protein L24